MDTTAERQFSMNKTSSSVDLRVGTGTFERLLWVMPAVFAVHICEEWFVGFRRYVTESMHGPAMGGPAFILNNALFMAVLVSLSVWASRGRSRLAAFLLLAWASGNLFWDFVVHLVYTVLSGRFSPGLISATLFYYPLTFLVAAVAVRERRLSTRATVAAFALGSLLMWLVLWGGLYHFGTPAIGHA